MTITTSEWVERGRVTQLNKLIKSYNGKVIAWNASMFANDEDRYYLTYSFDCPQRFNLFSEDWHRLTTPITEKNSWRVTLKNFLSRLF